MSVHHRSRSSSSSSNGGDSGNSTIGSNNGSTGGSGSGGRGGVANDSNDASKYRVMTQPRDGPTVRRQTAGRASPFPRPPLHPRLPRESSHRKACNTQGCVRQKVLPATTDRRQAEKLPTEKRQPQLEPLCLHSHPSVQDCAIHRHNGVKKWAEGLCERACSQSCTPSLRLAEPEVSRRWAESSRREQWFVRS